MQSHSLATARWSFRDCSSTRWLPATVPGCVHTDLHRAGRIPDPFWGTNELDLQWIEERDWEYRCSFTVPAGLLDKDVVELVADGLDTVATVMLNGHEIARTENMFIAHRWNVKPLLQRGRNLIVIRFDSAVRYARTERTSHDPGEVNDPKGGAPVIRKQQSQFGWDWGPRFVSAGIWRDIRLEAWTGNRLTGMRVAQEHAPDGAVTLKFHPELARRAARIQCTGTVSVDGRMVSQISDLKSEIPNPQLWWPNGHGAQPLYTVDLEVSRADGTPLGRWTRRIGLRTIRLDRSPDAAGEKFQFVVNGRPIFAKGANWIPAHSFVSGLTRDDYARDLRGAAEANMNMVRAWGGGIYESEDFYDLCDEFGLLVWQDFMFACATYPADRRFVESVRVEAQQQVARLRHRACLALWCGNNETELLNRARLENRKLRREYDALFTRVLPDVVRRYDGTTDYWPSSPHRSDGSTSHEAGEQRGDTHYWEVWHARKPVREYEKWRFRFVSEFGMQSYSSPETNATFCDPQSGNVFGPAMENHQKNRGGNQVILDYVSRRYRLPKTQEDLIYLSQLNQAYCMQTGVEHYRRLMPHCMGALYWQLNDCWPVASWSSIEFTGRWRALHHVARRFFSPALVTAYIPGDETAGTGNYRLSTIRDVHIYTVYDAPGKAMGTLRWDLFHIDGRVVLRGSKPVKLVYGESVAQQAVDLSAVFNKHGRDNILLRIALIIDSRRVSEETVFFSPPRFIELPRGRAQVVLRMITPQHVSLMYSSPVFQHRFNFDIAGVPIRVSDNFFELYPDEPKRVDVMLSRPMRAAEVRRRLKYFSLVDTY